MKRRAADSELERPKKRQRQFDEIYSILVSHLEQGQTNEQCLDMLSRDYPDVPLLGMEEKLNELRQTLVGSQNTPILTDALDQEMEPKDPGEPIPIIIIENPIPKSPSYNLPKINELWMSGKILGCYFEELEMNRLTKGDIDSLGLPTSAQEEDGFILFVTGTCLFRLGNTEESNKYFEAGFAKLRGSERTTNNLLSLGCICKHFNKADEAQQYFLEASQTAKAAVHNAQFGLYCVDGDPITSIHHLHVASEKGNKHAQYELGRLYSGNALVEKNSALESKYYELAAHQGHRGANYTLGCQYYEEKEYQIAMGYFLVAAQKGATDSHFYLGEMYFYGHGVSTDYNEALKHLTLAITSPNPKPVAFHYLGEIHFLHKNYVKAFNFLSEAVGRDQREASYALGQCFHHGLGVEVQLQAAINCYQNAADHRSFHALGDIYCGLNDTNLATLYYMHALDKDNTAIHTLKALAELYWNLKNFDLSLLHYQTLAKLDPGFDYGANNTFRLLTPPAKMERRAKEEKACNPRPPPSPSSNGLKGMLDAGLDVVNGLVNIFRAGPSLPENTSKK